MIDPLLRHLVPAGDQVRLLPEGEGSICSDVAQSWIPRSLPTDFAGIGDHDVCRVVDHLLEDGVVVRVLHDGGLLEVRFVELRVGAPRVDDHPHPGSVDVSQRPESRGVGAPNCGGLAIAQIRRGVPRLLRTIEGDADPAHRHVALAVQIIHQIRPRRGYQVQLDAEAGREVTRQVDVQSAPLPLRISIGEGPIVTRAADAHKARGDDTVEVGR